MNCFRKNKSYTWELYPECKISPSQCKRLIAKRRKYIKACKSKKILAFQNTELLQFNTQALIFHCYLTSLTHIIKINGSNSENSKHLKHFSFSPFAFVSGYNAVLTKAKHILSYKLTSSNLQLMLSHIYLTSTTFFHSLVILYPKIAIDDIKSVFSHAFYVLTLVNIAPQDVIGIIEAISAVLQIILEIIQALAGIDWTAIFNSIGSDIEYIYSALKNLGLIITEKI